MRLFPVADFYLITVIMISEIMLWFMLKWTRACIAYEVCDVRYGTALI